MSAPPPGHATPAWADPQSGLNPVLALLLDTRAPAGAHAHSAGMEAAVTAGLVNNLDDVEAFCAGRARTSGRVAAAFAAAACALDLDGDATEWDVLDAEYDARCPSEALRWASRSLGSGLRRMARSMFPSADLTSPWARCRRPGPHHPVMLGAAVALAGGSPDDAARAATLAAITAPASAAVRLLGLDPLAVQGMLTRLATTGAAPGAVGPIAALPADGAPFLDLLAEVHRTAEVRLFAS